MRLRFWMALAIFLGSYLPLSTILLVQNFEKNPTVSVIFTTICGLCFLLTWILMRSITPRQDKIAVEIKHIPNDLFNYVVPYIVSFVSVDYSELGKTVGFIIFISWIFIIIFKSDRIIMNPMLVVFGWKLYEVKYKDVGSEKIFVAMILSAIPLEPGTTFKADSIQDVMIVR